MFICLVYNVVMTGNEDRNIEICERIAELVREKGGRVFYVGGYVRDELLKLENKDIDIEVHGILPEELFELLQGIGHPRVFGSSFGVYSLDGYDVDIAMPRKEKAIGRGHRDFQIDVDPFIGYENAARRRDFTFNAMMEDVLTHEILDPFHGQEDLKNHILRHVDEQSFAEDPLRVLRAGQFAARFDCQIAEETLELCRGIDITTLSRERVEEELKKALTKGSHPSIFFESLKQMQQLDYWFKEVKQLIGVKQDPIYHPEGDVWVHTMQVLDKAASYRDKVTHPYYYMLLALCHDFGKILASEEIDGRIHAYGHEEMGLPLIEAFLRRLTSEHELIRYVCNMTALHMKPNALAHDHSSLKASNRMFDEAYAPLDLIYMALADQPILMGKDAYTDSSPYLFERYALYQEMMKRPYVTGSDLIEAGLQPGEEFTQLLAYAHKLRLAGVDKEAALKQTLAMHHKNKGEKQ